MINFERIFKKGVEDAMENGKVDLELIKPKTITKEIYLNTYRRILATVRFRYNSKMTELKQQTGNLLYFLF
jgi:hypothetical protein